MYRILDDFLFDNKWFGYQTISEKLQKNIGINCFTLARISNTIYAASGLMYFLNQKFYFLTLLYCFAWIIFMIIIYLQENILRKFKNTINIQRYMKINIFSRYLFIFFLFDGLLINYLAQPEFLFIRFVSEFSFVCLFYFIACTPLPPSESKLKEWMRNTLSKTSVSGV